MSRVHSLLDGARQTTNHFLNISFSPFPPKKKCTLEKEHSDENLEGASDVLKSPRNGSSYSRELTSANVRPPKSSSASKDSHRSELKVERHASGVPESNSSENSPGKRQLKVRESNGALDLIKLQRRHTSAVDESREVLKSSNTQRSEKSEVKFRERSGRSHNISSSKHSNMAKDNVQESPRVLTSSYSKHSDERDNKLVIKQGVRVLNSSSLNRKDEGDHKDSKRERKTSGQKVRERKIFH